MEKNNNNKEQSRQLPTNILEPSALAEKEKQDSAVTSGSPEKTGKRFFRSAPSTKAEMYKPEAGKTPETITIKTTWVKTSAPNMEKAGPKPADTAILKVPATFIKIDIAKHIETATGGTGSLKSPGSGSLKRHPSRSKADEKPEEKTQEPDSSPKKTEPAFPVRDMAVRSFKRRSRADRFRENAPPTRLLKLPDGMKTPQYEKPEDTATKAEEFEEKPLKFSGDQLTKTKPRPSQIRKKIIKTVSFLFMLAFWCAFSFVGILLAVTWINSAGLVPVDSPAYGFDYIPAYMLIGFVFPVFVYSLLIKKWPFGTALLVLFIIFWGIHGDHSLFSPNVKTVTPAKGEPVISVLTINVAQFHDGIEIMGKKLEEVRPDVILFQEHEHFGYKNHELIRRHFPSYNVRVGEKCDSGIMSLYPIEEFNEVQLPSHQPKYANNYPEEQVNHPHRHFPHGVIVKDGKRINVLCLRLIAGRSVDFFVSPGEVFRWGKYLMATQKQEVEAMVDYMSGLEGPVIYGGDLNAPPNASVLHPFYAFGTDVYRATHRKPGGFTFPADGPFQRLDYIFCNEELVPYSSQPLNMVISDHRPLYAVMGFKKPAKTGEEKRK